MMTVGKLISAAALLILTAALPAAAQKATVSGYITDSKTGETLIGAGVVESATGAVTNSYGFYTITLPKGPHTLTFSYVGYTDETISLDLRRDTTISVALKPGLKKNSITPATPSRSIRAMSIPRSCLPLYSPTTVADSTAANRAQKHS